MKTIPNDGGFAYPTLIPESSMGCQEFYEGMSLRDYFAGQAVAGVSVDENIKAEDGARYAYEFADAMIIERSKLKETP